MLLDILLYTGQLPTRELSGPQPIVENPCSTTLENSAGSCASGCQVSEEKA